MNGKGILIGSVLLGLLAGCSSQGKKPQETPTNGTINISVDESFRPVIDSQIKVFESSFPDVHIVPHYKPEAECFRDLSTDSTRMVIVTRSLSREEEKFYVDSFHLTPTEGPLAYDAIAVLVHPGVKDSVFDMIEIKDMLSGKDTQHQPVMDGLSATSTVRYAIDSVLRGQPSART
ncbi:substrate-binding domain-containing protein [Puia sp. P3]|uniref:substrate-binding domain-containing protein n=1 Tax=Puia sp. P3 TaxID=3423952 RepID=UPI003D67C949